MPTNRFKGDAPPLPKIVRLLGPGGSGPVSATITVGNRAFLFAEWDASEIASSLSASTAAELVNLTVEADEDDVVFTGPDDDDFKVSLSYRPIVTVTNEPGVTRVNQQTRLNFGGARGGTYTLTINGLTTAAIDYGDEADLIDQIELLSGWTAGDAVVISATPDNVILEFRGTLAGLPVSVVMDGTALLDITTLTITELTPYRPSPHDVYLMALDASTTCSVTIDGSSATIRSDDSLATVRQKLQALSARKLNVYGGPNGTEDAEGIVYCHYVLDFEGWDASTRPTVSVTPSDGDAEVKILNDPTSATGFTGQAAASAILTFGQCNHWLLDFTEGGTIELEYDGVAVTVTAPASVAAVAAKADEIRGQLRDASEYDEAWVDYTATGWAMTSETSRYLLHVVNVNESLRQIGGAGSLVQLNKAGSAAAGAVHHVNVPAGVDLGTFKLTLPEGTTSALAADVSAASMETALDLLTSVTVSGTGTPADPWVITYPSASGPRDLPVGTDVLIGGGSDESSVTLLRESVRAVTQTARFSIGNNAASGSFSVKFGNEGPVKITLGDAANTVDAALATMPSIGDASYITTTYDADSKAYDIVFASNLAGQQLPLFTLFANELALITLDTVEVTQRATGPRNFAEPSNWSLGRIPHNGDSLLIEAAVGDIKYGLRQYIVVTADTSTEVLTAAGGHDLRDGQVIRFATSGTIPTGLSDSTDYYVLDADNEAGTFRVSAAAGGSPVNITSAGSGTIYAGVRTAGIRIGASYTDELGRAERTAENSTEYLQRYLCIGLSSGVIEIGGAVGRGSGLIRLNLGYSAGAVSVLKTDSPAEQDRPALSLLVSSASLDLEVASGDVGLAAFDNETSAIGDLSQKAGTLTIGEATATTLAKTGGRLLSRSLTISGSIVIQG